MGPSWGSATPRPVRSSARVATIEGSGPKNSVEYAAASVVMSRVCDLRLAQRLDDVRDAVDGPLALAALLGVLLEQVEGLLRDAQREGVGDALAHERVAAVLAAAAGQLEEAAPQALGRFLRTRLTSRWSPTATMTSAETSSASATTRSTISLALVSQPFSARCW